MVSILEREPTFNILVDGVDKTATLADRKLSLSLSDNAGWENDTLNLTFDNRAPYISPPRVGAVLAVSIGYKGQPLVFRGLFTVNETEINRSAATLTVRANAADLFGSLKSHKTKSWDQKTIGDIVNEIAGQHGLKAAVSPDLASIKIDHVDQINESDLHFLTNLAKRYHAVCKAANQTLVFAKKGEAKSASGLPLVPIYLSENDCQKLRHVNTAREVFKTVKAHYGDQDKAEKTEVKAGSGEPEQTLKHSYATKEEAEAAAQAALDRSTMAKVKLSGTCWGDPAMFAEGPLFLSSTMPGFLGAYLLETVSHKITGTGVYKTDFTACLPGDQDDA